MVGRMRTVLAAVVLLGATAGWATTVIPMSDQSLVARATLVVVGVVRRIESVELAGSRFVTRITLGVEQTLKGRVAGDEVVVTEPGGDIDGRGTWIFGVPEFTVGEAVVVFLVTAADGTLTTDGLGLGKYGVEPDGAGGLRARSGLASDVRPLDGFLARLRALAAKSPAVGSAAVNGRVAADVVDGMERENFMFLGSPPGRWFEPDDGAPVQMLIANADPTFGPTVSVASVEAAMAAWTAVPTATITLANGGATTIARSVAGNFRDNTSRIQFDDPFHEVPDLDGACAGVVAVGGFFSNGELRSVNGTTFRRIVEGDVTVNNGGACFGTTIGAMAFAEVLTHEIGHAIGLAHSSENPSEPNSLLAEATMYFRVHNDGRGASVREDDVDGVSAIYAPDSDGDRVFDLTDACPGTPAGTAVDATGCACADAGHVACVDADMCTADSCDASVGLCRHDPIGCDDGDPCTDDACDPVAGCQHVARTGSAATTCAFEPRLASDVCNGQVAPTMAAQQFNRAGTLVARAQGAKPQRTKKLLRQAAAAVRKAKALVAKAGRRRKGPLPTECVAALNAILEEAERVLHAAGV